MNAFVIDGELIYLQETDRISFDDFPGGIIKEHHIPSKYSFKIENLRDELYQMIQKSVDRLFLENGPVYVQLKLKNEEDPKIIEITPRLDGCHIWRLIKHYSGADILDATFRLLFGEKKKAKQALKEQDEKDEYKLKFLMEKPNKTVHKEKYDLERAEFFEWYYEQGDEVREVNGFIEKVGYQIFRSKRR